MVSFVLCRFKVAFLSLVEGTSRLSNFYEFLAKRPDKIPTLEVEIN
ncbi:hypothetical protein GLIP_2445 [Aliiglaciecola lipolytica E3]|uniref:Uncharacterized protein n=1 Tax=Aliiglaciecola lipolytica E3 TaxID=1127673 RepID=K6XTR0_9ALTE|nr:hypothetical protein GLIP_2445 [Aliiglaciecola lipolytica E3]